MADGNFKNGVKMFCSGFGNVKHLSGLENERFLDSSDFIRGYSY